MICSPTANAIACGKSIGVGLHEHLRDGGLEEPDVARPEREQLHERRDEEDEAGAADRRVDVGGGEGRVDAARSARPTRARPRESARLPYAAGADRLAAGACRGRSGAASRAPAARA